MRRARRAPALAPILTLWAVLVAPLATARAEPPLWTVHGPRGTVYLFGSVHMLPEGAPWRGPALDAALARAQTLWFEIPIDAATDAEASRLAARRARLPPGDTLWAHLTGPQRDRVERAARAAGVAPATLAPLRPWMAELTLSLAADARGGARPNLGVETTLQGAAPPAARRRALENARQQIAFLTGGDLAEQIASLDESAREIIADPDLYARSIRAWLAGDLAALSRDDLEPLRAAAPGAYRRLILDRNRRWAALLGRLAREGGVSLVVVGAGHLIGPDGVPALLRAQGLTVEGP